MTNSVLLTNTKKILLHTPLDRLIKDITLSSSVIFLSNPSYVINFSQNWAIWICVIISSAQQCLWTLCFYVTLSLQVSSSSLHINIFLILKITLLCRPQRNLSLHELLTSPSPTAWLFFNSPIVFLIVLPCCVENRKKIYTKQTHKKHHLEGDMFNFVFSLLSCINAAMMQVSITSVKGGSDETPPSGTKALRLNDFNAMYDHLCLWPAAQTSCFFQKKVQGNILNTQYSFRNNCVYSCRHKCTSCLQIKCEHICLLQISINMEIRAYAQVSTESIKFWNPEYKTSQRTLWLTGLSRVKLPLAAGTDPRVHVTLKKIEAGTECDWLTNKRQKSTWAPSESQLQGYRQSRYLQKMNQ